jgi:hypothetical protein
MKTTPKTAREVAPKITVHVTTSTEPFPDYQGWLARYVRAAIEIDRAALSNREAA